MKECTKCLDGCRDWPQCGRFAELIRFGLERIGAKADVDKVLFWGERDNMPNCWVVKSLFGAGPSPDGLVEFLNRKAQDHAPGPGGPRGRELAEGPDGPGGDGEKKGGVKGDTMPQMWL